MRQLSPSVALAQPGYGEIASTVTAVAEARDARRPLEVRIGVGPLNGSVPARVLGYAACVADALRVDLPALVGRASRLRLFSSAPKASVNDTGIALRSLVALAGALRLAGVAVPIELDFARPEQEVPASLVTSVPASLERWLMAAGARSGNHVAAMWYAREHAAPSMFGDLAGQHDEASLRITLGGAAEARFWAVRVLVREAAIAAGLRVVPALGLILRTCRIPWYSTVANEPSLQEMRVSPSAAITRLDGAANPKYGGNAGLVREARAARRFLDDPGVAELADAIATTESARRWMLQAGFEQGKILGGLVS